MRLLLTTILFFVSLLVSSQNVSFYANKGQEAYDIKNYALASEYFLRAIEINPNIVRIHYKYAQSLRKNHDYKEAARWYRKVFRKSESDYPMARFYFATCSKMEGEYASAFSAFNRFYKLHRLNEQLHDYVMVSKHEKHVCERLKDNNFFTSIQEVSMLDEPVSSNYGEFSPVQLSANKLLMSTFREFIVNGAEVVTNGILLIHFDENKNVIKTDTLLIDAAFNYSLGTVMEDVIYFSKCPVSDSTTYCKIFKAQIKEDTLVNIEALSALVNQPGSNSRHPSVVGFDDELHLLFASDREGGFGKNDIWYCTMNNQGVFDSCQNAGKFINSMEDELTPSYYMPDTVLYFSSRWHGSRGGFDIFNSYGNFKFWTTPVNVGDNINTSYDDLYFRINENTRIALFVSSRKKDKFNVNCCHDVYTFDVPYSKNDSIRTVQYVAREKERKQLVRTELKLLTPLDLYFQNDSPDPGSRDSLTEADLSNLLTEYVDVFETYETNFTKGLSAKRSEKARDELSDFFIDQVEAGKDDLDLFATLLEQALVNGDKIVVSVQAFTSPLNNKEYNELLAKRRIGSLLNFLNDYNKGIFINYMHQGMLSIEQIAYGESKSPDYISDDIRDLRNSVYSPQAAKERRIQIQAVSVNSNQ